MMAALVMGVTVGTAVAKDSAPPGPGEGNYDCSACIRQGGGWGGPPIFMWYCVKTPGGSIGGCQGGTNGCTSNGGCVSLPDGIGTIGYAP